MLHLARAITRDFRAKIRSSYLSGSPYSEDNPILREDPLGKWAIGAGFGGGGNIPGLYGDGSTFWVLTFNPHPFDVEIGTVTSAEGGGTTAVLGGSGAVRVMTSKSAQSLQDFQGWGATGGVSGKLGLDLGLDFGAARVDDPTADSGHMAA